MGRASRAKRERRNAPPPPPPAERRRLPVFWIVVVGLVVTGLVAVVVSNRSGSSTSTGKQSSGADSSVYSEVEVAGAALPKAPADNDAEDPAVGQAVPTVSGTGIDGKPVEIAPGSGPAVIVAMAHWCPHCQREIPRIVERYGGKQPDGVRIVGVSTAAAEDRPNFPPSSWLADEDWTYPTLVDDEVGTAADALGLDSFPLLVFVDADGKVASRFSGEMEMDEFAARVKELRGSQG